MSIEANNVNMAYRVPMQAMGQSTVAAPNAQVPHMSGYQDTSLAKSLDKSEREKYITMGLTVPTWLGLTKLYSLITKANNGAYEKSLVGRIAKVGDMISDNALTRSTFGQKVKHGMRVLKVGCKKVINKSSVLSAMFNTPSVPEYKMVRDMSKGAVDEVAGDFVSFVDKYVKKGGSYADLGLTEAEFKAIQTNPTKNLKRIKDICNKVGSKYSVKEGMFHDRLMTRDITLQQVGNRLKAMTDSTKGGKFLSRLANRGAYGLFLGGSLWALLSAHAIVDAAMRSKKAEKGDKFPTFMEGFLGNISWVITFPLGIKLMNAVAGLKYVGMSPKQVKQYREAVKAFNEKAAQGFASKAEYKAAKDALNAVKNAGKPGLIGKIFRLPGKLLSIGREVAMPFQKANPTGAQKVTNALRKLPYQFRNHPLAVLVGFGTYMAVFSPFVDKIFTNISYAIFGKPKHSMYDEEPEAEKADDKANTTAQTQPNPFEKTTISDNPNNLVNMYKNGQTYQAPQFNTVTQKTENTTTINNTTVNKSSDESDARPEQHRTYIPSPEGVKVQGEDLTPAEMAIRRSQAAEKQALETLAMKW